MCDISQSSEEIVSIDDGKLPSNKNIADGGDAIDQISLSKKALHQRDADENLFLRFLELDPPQDQGPNRRQSASLSYKSSNGRTPFTISKKLTRTGEKGYGLSLVWTHPPRVERVEPGLSAERSGISSGDYIVFIDKHNVVTMPEVDVLNLIKAQGDTLFLEIFRRPKHSNGIAPRLSNAPTIPTSIQIEKNYPQSFVDEEEYKPRSSDAESLYKHLATSYSHLQPQIQQMTSNSTLTETEQEPLTVNSRLSQPPVLPSACSNSSLETSKRKLNLPQVTFSKEVGKGVLV